LQFFWSCSILRCKFLYSTTVGSPGPTTPNHVSKLDSPVGLNLVADLSSYHLQQPSSLDLHASHSVIHYHLMVLRSRLPKTAYMTTFLASSVSPPSRVTTPLVYKPIFT